VKEQYRQNGKGSETVYIGAVFIRVGFRLECYAQRKFLPGWREGRESTRGSRKTVSSYTTLGSGLTPKAPASSQR
jgi:hypothetical protein